MDFIVLDIEFNGRKFASNLPMEVIEIGAVRLTEQLQVVDEFSSLIKPVYFSKLNSFIRQKTGITQIEINRAPGFPKVISEFDQWLAKSPSHLFLTWGGEDLKRIIFDIRMHKLSDEAWMTHPYFDLLKGYLRCKGLKNDVSVERALQELQIEPSGNMHRALDDAKMTAEVFRAVYAELDLTQSQPYKDAFSNSKERRMVRNAVKAMIKQQVKPDWTELVEKHLASKIPLTDPRKLSELQEIFTAECAKTR